MYLITFSYCLSRGQDYPSGLSSCNFPTPLASSIGSPPHHCGLGLVSPGSQGKLCPELFSSSHLPFCSGLSLLPHLYLALFPAGLKGTTATPIMGGGLRPSPFSSGLGKILPPPRPRNPPAASQITSPKAVSAGKKPSWARPELKHFLAVGKRREPPRDQGPELGEALPHLQWSARRCLCVCGLPRPRGARGEAAHTMVQPLRKAGGSGRPQPRARRRGPAASRPWCVPYCPLRTRHGIGRRFASLPARPFPRQASPGAAACTPSAAAGRSPPPLPSLLLAGGGGRLLR